MNADAIKAQGLNGIQLAMLFNPFNNPIECLFVHGDNPMKKYISYICVPGHAQKIKDGEGQQIWGKSGRVWPGLE